MCHISGGRRQIAITTTNKNGVVEIIEDHYSGSDGGGNDLLDMSGWNVHRHNTDVDATDGVVNHVQQEDGGEYRQDSTCNGVRANSNCGVDVDCLAAMA